MFLAFRTPTRSCTTPPAECDGMSDALATLASMKNAQQVLPFPQRGGARKNAGRKRKAPRPQVPHRPRLKFRNAAVHVTLRVCDHVWNLRTQRCFNALRRAFERGCGKFGVRVIHFSVQGNHIHAIVEAADADSLARAMKGLQV